MVADDSAAVTKARRVLRGALGELCRRPDEIEELGSTMPCAVYLLDIQHGRLVYDNLAIPEMLGVPPGETLDPAERAGFADRVHPDDVAAIFTQLAQWNAAEEGTIIESRFRLRHHDGTYRAFVALSALASRDDEGRAAIVLGCATEIGAPEPGMPSASERPPTTLATLLLVEGHPDLLRVATRELESTGYAVLVAANAFEALAWGDTALSLVDVVITDVALADLPGPELVHRLSERGVSAPTIYFASDSLDEAFATAVRGTEYSVLRRPIDPAELIRRVESVTKRR